METLKRYRLWAIVVSGILFRFDLIVGILSTLAGVLLLAHPTGALTVLPIILGFYIIIDSVFSHDSMQFSG